MKNIIDTLGYSSLDSLYYSNSSEVKDNRFVQKLFNELAPIAIYVANNKPFIIFFESTEKSINSDLVKKVWNAQIPLLMISFDNRIEVYNGCSIDENEKLILLEKIDDLLINESSLFSFWNISNPKFWKEYEKKLTVPKLDEVMLDNIKDATHQLRETKCAPFAVKIILRLIFIRYLIDRGVDLDYHGLNGNIIDSQSQLLTIMQDKTELYGLFTYLKERFNGNLFELYVKNDNLEINLLDEYSLKTLRDLMAGDLVLSSGQMSLFPLYDFNIIPVELISNIYERFLGNEKQQKDKAFYTPPYLVNYLLEQTINPFLEKNVSCRILDPACGSGIFLVESARKLIDRSIICNYDDFDDKKLINVITENLWGIDKNPEAIDVAIFSIYLTILDYKDPKTLKNFKLPLLKEVNFFVNDFFSEDINLCLEGKHFDFIIGNPPWGSISGPHIKYCEERKLPIQGKEISRSFVLRTKDFADQGTCCCLIVTSKLFYNKKSPSIDFRKWLLEKTQFNKYIELAAVRELIFTKARGPAGVLIYRFNDLIEENKRNSLCHLTLKPNIFFKLFNIIVIEKNDFKYIPQSLLLENDWAWKTIVFGYYYDFLTIKNVKEKYQSVNQIINDNDFSYGRGIEVHEGDKEQAEHLKGRILIDAKKGVCPFFVDMRYSSEFNKDRIHRAKAKKQDIFVAPFTLIKKGFDITSYKYRAAYSEDVFIYPDAVTGISGKEENKETLLSLAGMFNSSVYAYFNLMLGASSGIEREQGFPTEIFKYPAVVDKQIAKLTEKIQAAVSTEKTIFNNSIESEKLIHELDGIVMDKFELSDDVFVDYALNVQIPLISKNKMIWEKVTDEQMSAYADIFIQYFSKILPCNEKYISINYYKNIAGHYCAVEFVFQDTKPDDLISEYDGVQNTKMDFVSKFMLKKVNNLFYQIKDVIDFSENSFYILKTEEYKNWHPAIAKLDLEDVLDSILSGNGVSKL